MNEICKQCRKPIHWVDKGTEDGGAWYHDHLVDTFDCPAYPVEMVLSGPAA